MQIRVEMKIRSYNRNAIGSHFGGSLYAMTDPFYVIMLIKALGRGYIVWDKAASIEFVKPGYGTVTADFSLSDKDVGQIINYQIEIFYSAISIR